MKPSRYAWAVVALLWVVATLNYLDRQVIFSLFPPLKAEFGVSDLQLGLLGTAFLWVYGLLSPFSGYLADRYDRVKVVIFSLFVWSAVTWLTGQAHDFNQLLTARGLMGISEAAYLPAALALIADYHSPATRSRATGIHQSGLYAGIALGGVVGGWVGEHYGWRAVFGLLGFIGIAYGAVLLFALKPPPARESAPKLQGSFVSALSELLSTRGFLPIFTANLMGAMAYFMIYGWLPLFLYEKFGMSLTGAGFSATFYIQIASAAGILAGGWLADRWTRSNPRGRVLTQWIGFTAAAPALFLVATTPSMALLIAGMLIFGLGRGFFDCNLMPVLCQVARPQLRATGYGVLNLGSTLVGGAMTAAAGALKATLGLGTCLQISAVLLFCAALMLLRIPAPRPSDG
ncbi:MAG: MFS transporter [Candidatus Solibacter usitatus]|nr:MFS transporter [Candidatus Solibacter usitatus]